MTTSSSQTTRKSGPSSLPLHHYAEPTIVSPKSDSAGRPGSIDQVLIDVPAISAVDLQADADEPPARLPSTPALVSAPAALSRARLTSPLPAPASAATTLVDLRPDLGILSTFADTSPASRLKTSSTGPRSPWLRSSRSSAPSASWTRSGSRRQQPHVAQGLPGPAAAPGVADQATRSRFRCRNRPASGGIDFDPHGVRLVSRRTGEPNGAR